MRQVLRINTIAIVIIFSLPSIVLAENNQKNISKSINGNKLSIENNKSSSDVKNKPNQFKGTDEELQAAKMKGKENSPVVINHEEQYIVLPEKNR